MFLGHYGLAFAAKSVAPRTSLGSFTFAAQFLDELWPILVLLGVERLEIVPSLIIWSSSTEPRGRYWRSLTPLDFSYYPFSHSLLMAIVWGILVGGGYFLLRRYGRGAWVIGVLVVSHWFLDLVVHRWDLPLWPGANSTKLGWGLWNYLAATYVVEFTIYAVGMAIYLRATRARDGIGRWGLGAYAALLLVIYAMSNGFIPPSDRAVAWSALGIWLLVPLAWWVDRHRMSVQPVGLTPERPSTF